MPDNINPNNIHKKLDEKCKKILMYVKSEEFLTNEMISLDELKEIPLIFTKKSQPDEKLSQICQSFVQQKQKEEEEQEKQKGKQKEPLLITKYTTILDTKKNNSIKLKMLTKFIEYCIETGIEPTEPKLTHFLDNIFVFDDLFRFTVILK